MKKLVFASSLALILLSLALTAAFALEFENIYMISGPDNTTQKTDAYILGQSQPWFFIQFSDLASPETVIGNSSTLATWRWDNPSGDDYRNIIFYNKTQNGVLGNIANWTSVEKLGNWSIHISSPLNPNAGTGIPKGTYVGDLQFKVSNVVPEPASAILYILGGGSLLAGFFRKRK
jgi:hypothetical protein